MSTAKEPRAGRRSKERKPRTARGSLRRSLFPQPAGVDSRRPLFVFNVKLFDDGLLPPILDHSSAWPHRYVVVIRREDGTVQGDGPLRTRLEADMAADRARLALPGSRVHLVVAPDESEDELEAFFADPGSTQAVAEEGARARDRYEEWRRKAGPVRPSYRSTPNRRGTAFSPAFT